MHFAFSDMQRPVGRRRYTIKKRGPRPRCFLPPPPLSSLPFIPSCHSTETSKKGFKATLFPFFFLLCLWRPWNAYKVALPSVARQSPTFLRSSKGVEQRRAFTRQSEGGDDLDHGTNPTVTATFFFLRYSLCFF